MPALKLHSLNNLLLPSPIESYTLFGRTIHVKHDDKINTYLSGNKFRKLQALYEIPRENITTLISYGGTQSNAMLSIAALCYAKGWEFIYYTKKISHQIQNCNTSNFSLALDLHMQVVEIEEYKTFIEELHQKALFFDTKTLLIAQGGADALAQKGIVKLANEIDERAFNNVHVVLPSGTGTTALYLAKNLTCNVYTTACVGKNSYLRSEIESLESIPENLHFLDTQKKYHFAKPHADLLSMYTACKEVGLEIDLLYATVMFKALSENLECFDGDILYIHSGGLIGNNSMLERYTYKGLY